MKTTRLSKQKVQALLGFLLGLPHESANKGKMEGVYGKGVSKNCFYEVSTFHEALRRFLLYCTVCFPKGQPFHEWSANGARFHDCPEPATKLVE